MESRDIYVHHKCEKVKAQTYMRGLLCLLTSKKMQFIECCCYEVTHEEVESTILHNTDITQISAIAIRFLQLQSVTLIRKACKFD